MPSSKKHQSVAGVIFKNDQVLLIQRRDIPVWVLPGGGTEEGESLAQATIREVLEETGYHVKIVRKVGEFHPKNRLTKLTHIYDCEILSGNPHLGDETLDIQFFPINALPKLMPPPYQEWIYDTSLKLKKPLIKYTHSASYFVLLEKLLKHPKLVIKYFLRKWKKEILR